MTAPTFVAAGAANQGTGAVTYALPAGIAANDLLVLSVETANEAIPSLPTGGDTAWTAFTNSPVAQASAEATRLNMYWRRATASNAGALVADPGDHQVGYMLAFRGVSTVGNPFDSSTASTGASSFNHTVSGVSTVNPDTLLVLGVSHGRDIVTGANGFWEDNYASSGLTWSTGGNLSASGNNGNGGGTQLAWAEVAAAGFSTGNITFSFDSNTGGNPDYLATTSARLLITLRSASASISNTDTGSGTEGAESIAGTVVNTDTGSGAETESIAGTVVNTDTGSGTEGAEGFQYAFPDTDTGTGTEGPENIVQRDHHIASDNFNRVDESPLNVSSSGAVWTNV